jgi:hypothetical protein
MRFRDTPLPSTPPSPSTGPVARGSSLGSPAMPLPSPLLSVALAAPAQTRAKLLTSSLFPPASFVPILRGSNTGVPGTHLLVYRKSNQSAWRDAHCYPCAFPSLASMGALVLDDYPQDESNIATHIFY